MTADYTVHPQEHALMERGQKAARVGARILDYQITPMDYEDMGQEASLEYWQSYDRTGNDNIAFCNALRKARRYYWRKIRCRHTRTPLSLDLPAYDQDNGEPPSQLTLIAAPPQEDNDPSHGWIKSAWISDADLWQLVQNMHQYKRPTRPALETDAIVLRLLLEGYSNAAIATWMERTEDFVKYKRRNLKRWLKDYAERIGIDVSHITWGPGGWRRAHDYGLSGKRQGRRQ